MGRIPGYASAYDFYEPTRSGSGVDRKQVTSRNKNLINGQPGPSKTANQSSGGTEFAWGPTKQGIEGTKDYKTAVWAAEQLQKSYDKPFFMAIGIFKPHLHGMICQ